MADAALEALDRIQGLLAQGRAPAAAELAREWIKKTPASLPFRECLLQALIRAGDAAAVQSAYDELPAELKPSPRLSFAMDFLRSTRPRAKPAPARPKRAATIVDLGLPHAHCAWTEDEREHRAFAEARRGGKLPQERRRTARWDLEALAHIERGRDKAAAAAFQKSSSPERCWLERTEVLLRLRRDAEASRVLGLAAQAAERCPRPFARLTELYRIHFRAGRFEQAAQAGDELLGREPTLEAVAVARTPWPRTLSRASVILPAYAKKSLQALRRFAARAPKSPWPAFFHNALTELGAPRNPSIAAPARLAPRHAWMAFDAASRILRDGGPLADARAALRELGRARAAGPSLWHGEALRAEILACLGRGSQAPAIFDRLARLAPKDRGEILAWKGAVLLWLGRYRDSLRASESALRAGSRYAGGWKGAALAGLGRLPEALTSLDEQLKAYPLDREARQWRAEVLWRRGRPRQALADLKEVERTATRADLYCDALAGLCLARLRRDREARERFRRMEGFRLPGSTAGALLDRRGARGAAPEARARALLEESLGVRKSGHEVQIMLYSRRP